MNRQPCVPPWPLDLDTVIKLVGQMRETAILVVDADPEETERVRSQLEAAGYFVRTTASPHDALELAEQIRFDVILIDAQLPMINGLNLYLAIKKITPTTVAIMMTGREKEFEELAREAVRRTAYGLVWKPLDLEYLVGLLERIRAGCLSHALHEPEHEAC